MSEKITIEPADGWNALSIETGTVSTQIKLSDDDISELIKRLAKTYPNNVVLPESEGEIVECPNCGVQAVYQEAAAANCRVVCNDCETGMRSPDFTDKSDGDRDE